MVVSAIRNTQGDLYALVSGDFTGQNNFIYWMVAILLIGALGYVPKLKSFSVAFLGLVVLVLFLSKGNPGSAAGGFFQQFTAALGTTTSSPSTATTVIGPNSTALPPATINLPALPTINNLVN